MIYSFGEIVLLVLEIGFDITIDFLMQLDNFLIVHELFEALIGVIYNTVVLLS